MFVLWVKVTALQQLCRKPKEDPKGLFGSSCVRYKTGKEINQKGKKKGQNVRKRNSPTFVSYSPVHALTPAASARPLTPDPSLLLKSHPAA